MRIARESGQSISFAGEPLPGIDPEHQSPQSRAVRLVGLEPTTYRVRTDYSDPVELQTRSKIRGSQPNMRLARRFAALGIIPGLSRTRSGATYGSRTRLI